MRNKVLATTIHMRSLALALWWIPVNDLSHNQNQASDWQHQKMHDKWPTKRSRSETTLV